jgi:hypothetical protein
MAAISVTAASVQPGSGDKETRICGAAISVGQLVYVDTNGLVQVATNAAAASAACKGVALGSTSASGQYVTYQKNGSWTVGGTVALGKPYAVGTAGGIIPVDDIAGTEFITNVGVGISVTQIDMGPGPQIGGVAAAGAVS